MGGKVVGLSRRLLAAHIQAAWISFFRSLALILVQPACRLPAFTADLHTLLPTLSLPPFSLPPRAQMSNDVRILLPAMVAIMLAKFVADAATHSLYHGLLEVKCVPFLPKDVSLSGSWAWVGPTKGRECLDAGPGVAWPKDASLGGPGLGVA